MAGKRKPRAVLMHVRIDAHTHAKLEKAARERASSLNSEVVERLDNSFTLADMGGPKLERLLKLVAEAMRQAGEHGSFHATRNPGADGAWMQHPYAYDCAMKAAIAVLERFRPPGEIKIPPPNIAEVVGGNPEETRRWLEIYSRDLGTLMGQFVLRKSEDKK